MDFDRSNASFVGNLKKKTLDILYSAVSEIQILYRLKATHSILKMIIDSHLGEFIDITVSPSHLSYYLIGECLYKFILNYKLLISWCRKNKK